MTPNQWAIAFCASIAVLAFLSAFILYLWDRLTKTRAERDRALGYAGRVYRAIHKGERL